MHTKEPPGSRRTSLRAVAALAAVTFVVAACGDGETTSTDATAGAGGEPETTELTVGVLPIIDVAPLYIAIEEGFFEEEGLTVEPQTGPGGAAIVSSVVGGEFDIGFSAYTSFYQARQEGIGLRVIAEALRSTPEFTGVYAMPDSGLTEAADLEGATVAVPTLQSICPLAISAVLDSLGADDSAVEFVEMPFPDMPPTLERGDIDGACLVEPFATSVKTQLGGVQVIDLYQGPTEEFPVAGYGTTEQFASENPNTVAAFVRAMTRASELANEDEERVRSILLSYTQIPEPATQEVILPRFVTEIDLEQLQRVADLMVEYDLLEAGFDVSTMAGPA